jgi:hypothetical protein
MSTYQQMPGFVSARVGDEMAVLDVENGSYMGFNPTATFVWRLLETPRSLEQLCAALEMEFDVETVRCRSEVSSLLGKLADAGLIRECDQDAS